MKKANECETWSSKQTAHMMIGQALRQTTPDQQKAQLALAKKKFTARKFNVETLERNLKEIPKRVYLVREWAVGACDPNTL